jgi:hypothetical protein
MVLMHLLFIRALVDVTSRPVVSSVPFEACLPQCTAPNGMCDDALSGNGQRGVADLHAASHPSRRQASRGEDQLETIARHPT